MYNLTVEGVHTFAVGDDQWVVHNCPPDGSGGGASPTQPISYRDFGHGSSPESIKDIVENGFSEAKAKAGARGGSVNRPGSFFAIELHGNEHLQLAYDFGTRKSDAPAVLILSLPDDMVESFSKRNIIELREIAGVPGEFETIFTPETFQEINDALRNGIAEIRVIQPKRPTNG